MVMRMFTGLALALAAAPLFAAEPAPSKYWVFIGTYTGKQSKGIYRCEFDATTGKLGKPELAAEVASPSFLAIHPTSKFLYAVGETGAGKTAGTVHAFALDAKTGELRALNSATSGGAGPCHISADANNVLVANYGGGSAEVIPIAADGKLAEPSCFVQHSGKSVNPGRQEGPHAHSINLDPSRKFAVVADLGLDQVRVYKFDAENGKITPNDPPFLKVADGAGPRHFAFHKTKPFAYVINEMACTINALTYTPDGKFEVVQTISTLPHELREGYSTAEVQVHPSGKFVYGSNRGQNSIVGFKVDQETGKLTLIGHQGEGIKTPRNFGIDPTGKWMIVGNQDGHSIIVYAINPETGELTPTGTSAEVGSPVCIKFLANE
jgi:6-phosphogluconolactonase